MKKTTILAAAASAALLCGASAFAQNMANHDTGLGGYGPGQAGTPMTSMSSMDENPFSAARRFIDEQEYAKAIPYLDEALRRRPGNSEVLAYEGYAHAKIGDVSTATDDLHQALASDPDSQPAHEFLGELFLQMHNLDGANAQLSELNRICSDGCDEKDALSKAIADYQPQASAAPASATAAPK